MNDNTSGRSLEISQVQRTVFAAGGLALSAWILVRLAMWVLQIQEPLLWSSYGVTGQVRLKNVLEQLPQIFCTPGEPLGLYFGSSLTQFDVSPQWIDAALHEQGLNIQSYNLAYPLSTPPIQSLLARQVALEAKACPHPVRVSVIEFFPYFVTRAAQEYDVIAAPTELKKSLFLNLTKLRFNELVDVLGYAALGGEFPTTFANVLADRVLERPLQLPVDFIERSNAWVPSLRGAVFSFENAGINRTWTEEHARLYGRRMFDGFYAHTDPSELHFSAEYERDFLDFVRTVKTFSSSVYVILLPRNPLYFAPSREGRERLSALLDTISKESTVIDLFENPLFDAGDFFDVVHLTPATGGPKLNTRITQFLLEDLRRDQ